KHLNSFPLAFSTENIQFQPPEGFTFLYWPMPSPVKISALVLTYNEEAKIANCLESLTGVADEIVVVDSFSTDGTEAICRRYDARFVQHAYKGYTVQQNYALEVATYDHVLVLDADEWLSDELRASVLAVKQNWDTEGGYRMNRLTNYYGKWLKRGGAYPDAKVRRWEIGRASCRER